MFAWLAVASEPTVRVLSGKTGELISETKPEAAKLDAGRNDPCPCGSGQKFKKCHGA